MSETNETDANLHSTNPNGGAEFNTKFNTETTVDLENEKCSKSIPNEAGTETNEDTRTQRDGVQTETDQGVPKVIRNIFSDTVSTTSSGIESLSTQTNGTRNEGNGGVETQSRSQSKEDKSPSTKSKSTAKSKSTGTKSGSSKKNYKENDLPTTNWCFTWNNPPPNYETIIQKLYDDPKKHITYIVFGRETGTDTQTFHLQGFLQLDPDHPMRAKEGGGPMKKLFLAHWTKARSITRAEKYCHKQDPSPFIRGTLRLRTNNGKQDGNQGRRSDIHDFQDAVKEGGMTAKRAREEFPLVIAKYPRFVADYISDHNKSLWVPTHALYKWQSALMDKLENYPPHEREIIFIIDYKGNAGKSYFTKYYNKMRGEDHCQMLNPGRVTDMAYALKEHCKVIFIDCPRSRQELFQYDFVEYLKNGEIFSSKYESRVKQMQPCHVVVFMNEDPDMTKLSLDRYKIVLLDEELTTPSPHIEIEIETELEPDEQENTNDNDKENETDFPTPQEKDEETTNNNGVHPQMIQMEMETKVEKEQGICIDDNKTKAPQFTFTWEDMMQYQTDRSLNYPRKNGHARTFFVGAQGKK